MDDSRIRIQHPNETWTDEKEAAMSSYEYDDYMGRSDAVAESGYYAPLTVKHTVRPFPAWTIYVGTTPNGEWVVEWHTIAAARHQREYFPDEESAIRRVEEWCK